MGVRHHCIQAGLWLAVAGAPLVWTTAVMAEYTLPKFLLLNSGAFVCAAGFLWSRIKGESLLRRTPADGAILAACVAFALAAFFSIDWRLSLTGRYNSYANGLWAWGLYLTLFYGAAWGLDEDERERTLSVCLWAGAAVGFYSIMQALGLEPFLRAERLIVGRSVASIGSPVDLGGYLAIILPLGLRRALGEGRGKFFSWTAFAVVAAGLLATTSRGSWGAGVFGCAVVVILHSRGAGPLSWAVNRRHRLILGAALLLLVALGARLVTKRFDIYSRSANDAGRMEGWKTAWKTFRLHPWIGTGPDTYELDFRRHRDIAFVRVAGNGHFHAHAHNDVLQSLATTGLAGTIPYLWLQAALILLAWRILREKPTDTQAIAVLGALAAWFLHVKFNPDALEVRAQVALLAGVLCAAQPPNKSEVRTRLPWLVGVPLVAALAAASLYAARLCMSDAWAKTALRLQTKDPGAYVLPELNKALAGNTCETAYHSQLINHIRGLINARKDVEERRSLLAIADAIGRKAVECHPHNVNSHYIAGFSAVMHAQLGLRDKLHEAERELDAAIQLDPMFVPILEARLDVARMTGDSQGVLEIARAISDLTVASDASSSDER